MHRDPRGGTFVIDRVFPGIGRIKRASGTTNPRAYRRIQRKLDALCDAADLETLRAVQRGAIALVELIGMEIEQPPGSSGDVRDKRKPCWIYVVLRRDTDEVKIGIAVDVRLRMRDLQIASAGPLELVAQFRGGRAAELEAHRLFAAYHIRGEWFRADPEILEWARKNGAQNFKSTKSPTN